MTRFPDFIREHRELKGWTQTEFGAMIGINSSAISRIEKGSKKLSPNRLEKLSELFDIPIDDIKELYFADRFAEELVKYDCPDSTFKVAEETVRYIKSKNTKQLTFEDL